MFVKQVLDDRKSSGRITVTVAGETGELSFVLSAGEYSRLGLELSERDEVSEEIYDALSEADERTRALCEAVRLLSLSEKSKRAVLSALKHKGFSDSAARNAVRILNKKGYLNDESSCRKIASSLVLSRHYGRGRVVSYLISHGYDVSDAKAAADEIADEDYRAALRYNIERKFPGIVSHDREKRRKEIAALMRLGFSADEIIGEIKKRGE